MDPILATLPDTQTIAQLVGSACGRRTFTPAEAQVLEWALVQIALDGSGPVNEVVHSYRSSLLAGADWHAAFAAALLQTPRQWGAEIQAALSAFEEIRTYYRNSDIAVFLFADKLISEHAGQTPPFPGYVPLSAPEDPRPVLMFVTDHGTQNRDSSTRNHYISLWRDNLDVQSYHRMLQPFGARRVISVMSQCFSGSFAWSIYPQPSQLNVPSGDRCGFFATTPDRPAYGCFADTRLGESIGHAYHFILAMKHAKTFDEAHRTVLLTDRTPDVPIRSSDSYLRSILEAEAREQGVTLTDLTDRLLRR
ncbi:MAG: hypothetical protein HUU06_04760, partial [Planctomycetaceae bacterium]|nr:hypothetical protein [Planctomycetaceae bacterium]